MPFSRSDARLRGDFLTTQIHSSGLLSTQSTAASQRLSSCNSVIKQKDMMIVTFLKFHTAASSLLLTSQHSLVPGSLVHTPSDFLDCFLLRLRGVSHSGLVLGVPDSRCASCALLDSLFLCASLGPRCSLLLSCNVTSLTISCVGILLRSHGLSIPPKGTLQRSFTLTLCGPCLVDHGLPDALTASFAVQSYLGAHLRCAACISRLSACWLYS